MEIDDNFIPQPPGPGERLAKFAPQAIAAGLRIVTPAWVDKHLGRITTGMARRTTIFIPGAGYVNPRMRRYYNDAMRGMDGAIPGIEAWYRGLADDTQQQIRQLRIEARNARSRQSAIRAFRARNRAIRNAMEETELLKHVEALALERARSKVLDEWTSVGGLIRTMVAARGSLSDKGEREQFLAALGSELAGRSRTAGSLGPAQYFSQQALDTFEAEVESKLDAEIDEVITRHVLASIPDGPLMVPR